MARKLAKCLKRSRIIDQSLAKVDRGFPIRYLFIFLSPALAILLVVVIAIF